MGVLYEHWRTDLSECFYVGMSWENPDTRPYDLKNRHSKHLKMQKDIEESGGKVEVRIIECDHLNLFELRHFEYLQTEYWKDFIGDRLVYLVPGGSHGVIWTAEMLEKKQQKLKEIRDKGEETPWQKGGKKIAQRALELKAQGKITPNQIGGKKNSERIVQMKERGEETPYKRGSIKGIITKRQKSKEEKEEINSRRNATIASKSDEEKARTSARRSASIRESLAKRTPEQIAEQRRKGSETRRKNRELKLAALAATENLEK
jgi:hypothetical protein